MWKLAHHKPFTATYALMHMLNMSVPKEKTHLTVYIFDYFIKKIWLCLILNTKIDDLLITNP